ncbi:MinD/ParA family protein [Pseudonocardia eucalypti]|uniref:MinD/ParA family protein n=1 Tax=Pseudonocardia eucalypti TaxID=648755 RepID=A0ABP9QB07_9PSEU|nr:MinD-like ATPase involved in chromosome partitioning or flagellar assembly [Pseudonocardia eucalypti]
MTTREPESTRTEHPAEETPAFDLGPPLTGPDGWAAARPRYPDGSMAPAAFDPRNWWPKHQHRFEMSADYTGQPDYPANQPMFDGTPPPALAADSSRPPAPVEPDPGQYQPRHQPPRPATGTAADLTDDAIVRPRAERPIAGWRGAVYAASGGRINPGVSEAEAARNVLLRRIRRHLPGAHQIAVSSLKGGVGKTTVSSVLGLTLAEHRGDRVVAVDANPDAGTLADRLTGEIGVTVRQMLDNIDDIDSLTAVSHYTSLAGRLQVLASEQDPAMSEAFSRQEYEQICAVLARFYNIIITDSGTGLVHSAMEGTLALADSLVVVGAPTVDGSSRASKTLDWLVAHGYAEMVADAVVVLCCDRVSPEIDRERVRAHFLGRTRAVVEIPYDPHLATGGRVDLAAMREESKHAFLELGALIADRFSGY